MVLCRSVFIYIITKNKIFIKSLLVFVEFCILAVKSPIAGDCLGPKTRSNFPKGFFGGSCTTGKSTAMSPNKICFPVFLKKNF